MQGYFLPFPPKGRRIFFFHEPGEEEWWGEFETPKCGSGVNIEEEGDSV